VDDDRLHHRSPLSVGVVPAAPGCGIRRARTLPGWVGIALPVVTLFAIVGSEAGTSLLIAAFLVVVGRRLARASSGAIEPVLVTASGRL
jgi:hypothetical protein